MGLGMKSTFIPKLGQKQINRISKFGAKASENIGVGATIAGLAGVAAPEVVVPLEVAGIVGNKLLKGLEKSTRKK